MHTYTRQPENAAQIVQYDQGTTYIGRVFFILFSNWMNSTKYISRKIGKDWTHAAYITVSHSNHYTKMFSVLV